MLGRFGIPGVVVVAPLDYDLPAATLYPVNVLNAIKNAPEVFTVFCATANQVEVLVAQTEGWRTDLEATPWSHPIPGVSWRRRQSARGNP